MFPRYSIFLQVPSRLAGHIVGARMGLKNDHPLHFCNLNHNDVLFYKKKISEILSDTNHLVFFV